MSVRFKAALFVLLASASFASHAVQYITGHITWIEPSYMPNYFMLQMDVGASQCTASMKWQNSNTDNNKAAYATLYAAMLTGKKIDFVINDGDATCTGQYIHVYSTN